MVTRAFDELRDDGATGMATTDIDSLLSVSCVGVDRGGRSVSFDGRFGLVIFHWKDRFIFY